MRISAPRAWITFFLARQRERGLHDRRQRQQHRDRRSILTARTHRASRTGLQPAGNSCLFAGPREYRPLRFLPRRIFLHGRAHPRHAGLRRCTRFLSGCLSSERWWSAAARLPIRRRSWDSREATTAAICTSPETSSRTRIKLHGSTGRHQLTAGVWFQRFQSNEEIALSQYGQLTFTGLPRSLVQRHGQFAIRSHAHASELALAVRRCFVEDTIRVSSRLTVSLGLPRRIHYRLERGVRQSRELRASQRRAQCQSATGTRASRSVGNSLFSKNHATLLPQPRLGVAWSPFGSKTVIRAGFGMYNDLQDALGYRADQNAPYNPTYSRPAATGASFR